MSAIPKMQELEMRVRDLEKDLMMQERHFSTVIRTLEMKLDELRAWRNLSAQQPQHVFYVSPSPTVVPNNPYERPITTCGPTA